MTTSVKLIPSDMIKKELKCLDKAEADIHSPSYALEVLNAKKAVRKAIGVQAINGAAKTRDYTDWQVALCRCYFRDVGENTFVYTADQMFAFMAALRPVNKENPMRISSGMVSTLHHEREKTNKG